MKKIFLLYLVFILLMLTGCIGISAGNEPLEIPDDAFISRMFYADENLYAIRSEGGYSYISHESSNPVHCYRLAEFSGGNHGDPIWHAPSGRLYFSNGHKVYSSDLSANGKELLWKFPRERKEDYARIMAVSDDCLVVCGFRWWSGQYPNRDYYSVNISTGGAVKLLDEVPSVRDPIVLCCYENTALFAQKDGQNLRVLSFDLLSGESRELGRIAYEDRIYTANGVVLNDTLYFICENDGIYSVPFSGGTIEYRRPDTAQMSILMNRLIAIEAYNDTLYILMGFGYDGFTTLCGWEPTANTLYTVAATDHTFSATGFALGNNTYSIFARSKYLSGELTAGK